MKLFTVITEKSIRRAFIRKNIYVSTTNSRALTVFIDKTDGNSIYYKDGIYTSIGGEMKCIRNDEVIPSTLQFRNISNDNDDINIELFAQDREEFDIVSNINDSSLVIETIKSGVILTSCILLGSYISSIIF